MDEHVNDSDHLKSESKRTKSSRRKSFKQCATGSDDTSRSSSNVNIDRLLYLWIRFSSC